MRIDRITYEFVYYFNFDGSDMSRKRMIRGYNISILADILKTVSGKKVLSYSKLYNFKNNYPKLKYMIKLKQYEDNT